MLNINKEKLGLGTKIYGFKIKMNNTIEYLEDAVGKTPAHMNYETGEFDWGGWSEDEFFIPRSVLFVNYKFHCYLDINNINRKDNGDILDCFGNLNSVFDYCMCFGGENNLWYAYIDDKEGGTEYVYFSNNQVNHNFIPIGFYYGMFPNDNNNHSSYGSEIEKPFHIYNVQKIPTYDSNKIGKIEDQVLDHLMMLLAKTINFDRAYGKVGNYDRNFRRPPIITGVKTADKGLFWGDNKTLRKVFGIEFYRR